MNASTATALTIVERVEQSAVVAALEQRTAALADLLPDEQAVARFKRGVIVAITKNPDLLNCTPDSIVLACFEAAQQGLEPTGAAGGAHLVPYKVNGTKVAQLIPDYRGVIRMVTRPGSDVVSIEARVVKEGDTFDYQLGTDAFVNHVPALGPDRSGKPTTHVYAIARLKGGVAIPDVEDRAGIERVRKRGANSDRSPWASDWDEMAKKSVIKRLAKVLPVRPEVRAILIREDELAGDVDDAPAVAASTGPTRAAQIGSRIRHSRNVTPAEASPVGASEPAVAEQPFGSPEPSLIDRLRTNAEVSSLVGSMTEPQQTALNALFEGVGFEEIAPVLGAAFDLEPGAKPSAAAAQAILSLSASMGRDELLAAWRAAATEAQS